MKVVVIGTGYVGLTTSVALAYLGHQVIGVDKDPAKLELLYRGESSIHEYGLQDLMTLAARNLRFTDRTREAVPDADVILVAVGTPSKTNGEADAQYVKAVGREVAEGLLPRRTYALVIKSIIPVGTSRRVTHMW